MPLGLPLGLILGTPVGKALDAVLRVGVMGMTEWMNTAPAWLLDAMDHATKWAGIAWRRTSGDADWHDDKRRPCSDFQGAEAWGSMVEPGLDSAARTVLGMPRRESLHVIAIDLDHEAALIPSSTPGHHHLVIDHKLCWSDYLKVLTVLAEVGVIQDRYLAASKARRETFLRLPWIGKGTEADDARRALDEWLEADERPTELQTPEALEEFLATPG